MLDFEKMKADTYDNMTLAWELREVMHRAICDGMTGYRLHENQINMQELDELIATYEL